MKIENVLNLYEIDGNPIESLPTKATQLKVVSHWNLNDRIEIITPEGKRYVVLAKQLLQAVTNATNHK